MLGVVRRKDSPLVCLGFTCLLYVFLRVVTVSDRLVLGKRIKFLFSDGSSWFHSNYVVTRLYVITLVPRIQGGRYVKRKLQEVKKVPAVPVTPSFSIKNIKSSFLP